MSHFTSTTPFYFEASCSHASALDPNFGMFVSTAASQLDGPSIIESVANEFSSLIPAEYLHLPLLCIYLDDEHADQFNEVKNVEPEQGCIDTVDMMQRRSTLHWETRTHNFHACTWQIHATLNLGGEWGELVLAVMSPQRVALRTLKVGDDFLLPIQAQEARSGINYRPYREHNDDALEAALLESVLLGNEEKCDEEGRRLVRLKPKVHLVVDQAGKKRPLA